MKLFQNIFIPFPLEEKVPELAGIFEMEKPSHLQVNLPRYLYGLHHHSN